MGDEGKFFMLRSQLNDMVLTIRDNNVCAGTDVITNPSHGGDNQIWYEDRLNSVIRSKADDNLVFDIQDDSLVVSEFNSEEYYQKWKVAGDHVELVEDGTRCLDIAQANDEEGARICCWEFAGDDHQKWNFEYRAPVNFYIRSKTSGKVIDIRSADDSPGAKLIIYDCSETWADNQTWYEDKYGNIRSRLNDFVFDSCETRIIMNEYDPDIPTRGWVKNGQKISRKDDPSLCIETQGGKDKNGTKLEEASWVGDEHQRWYFDYAS